MRRNTWVVLMVSILAGCGSPVAGKGVAREVPGPKVQSLALWSGCASPRLVRLANITRTRSLSSNPKNSRPLNVVAGMPGARKLYIDACKLLGLPQVARGTSCPADFGVYYHLLFLGSNRTVVARLTLDSSGCRVLAWGSGPNVTTIGTSVGTPGGPAVNLEYYGYHYSNLTRAFIRDLGQAIDVAPGQVFAHS